MDLAGVFVLQIDNVIALHTLAKSRSHYNDLGDVPTEVSEFIAASLAVIHRVSGSNSQYARLAADVVNGLQPREHWAVVPTMLGILYAVRRDLAAGYLVSLVESVHADVFSDFLEMADHLLDEGFKDPAAVLIGGVLETHVRKLCTKNTIDTEFTNAKGNVEPKKAETMNVDLAKEGVYGKLDQKNVTAWLALRNKAAHGHYDEYTKGQVELLLQSVRDFLTRHPA